MVRDSLPPGQTSAPLGRFGLPQFAAVRPVVPDRPVLWVGGMVRRPFQADLAELGAGLPRREQTSDLHCVMTWSTTGLRWSGIPFRALHERLAARVVPHRDCEWVVFVGMDGYRSCLKLEDALADEVLLAENFDGLPLTPDLGAPLRLIVPKHYGYKSVRHICAIEYQRRYDSGSARWMAHPRGRVDREERSRYLPGRLWRPLWRVLLSSNRRRYLDT